MESKAVKSGRKPHFKKTKPEKAESSDVEPAVEAPRREHRSPAVRRRSDKRMERYRERKSMEYDAKEKKRIFDELMFGYRSQSEVIKSLQIVTVPKTLVISVTTRAVGFMCQFLFCKFARLNIIRLLSFARDAKDVARTIDCDRTKALWNRLNSLFRYLDRIELPEIAGDICYYMLHNPDHLDPYLKCLGRVRSFLSDPATSLKILEEKATQLSSVFVSMIEESKAHQDETLKFADQVSHVSANLSGLQETIEQTVVKVSKLDILLI